MRAASNVIWLGLAVGWSGCATTGAASVQLEERPSCRVSEERLEQRVMHTRGEVEGWLRTFPYRGETGGRRRAAGRLVESYPGLFGEGQRRSYLYDNALGLLWYGWSGKPKRAARVAEALMALQQEDGSWGFSVTWLRGGAGGSGGRYRHSRRVRNGAVAWAVHALADHAERSGDRRALWAARRGATYLLKARFEAGSGVYAGLVGGGRHPKPGKPARGAAGAPVMEEMPVAITEHQLDTHMALRGLGAPVAEQVRGQILEVLWVEEQGRFAVAAGKDGVDHRRALDAAGAWGALWLDSIGERERAQRSLNYTVDVFGSEQGGLKGYRPYLDPIDGYDPEAPERHIFTEGTLGVGLAALRLGRPDLVRQVMTTAVEMECLQGPGLPYSNRKLRNFPTHPAAASSLWFLLLEREWRTGERAPIFAAGGGEQIAKSE